MPLNYRLLPADHAYIIQHAGVKALLVDHEYLSVADEIRSDLPEVELWISAQEEGPVKDGWTGWEDWIRDVDAPGLVPGRQISRPKPTISDRLSGCFRLFPIAFEDPIGPSTNLTNRLVIHRHGIPFSIAHF